MAQTNTPKLDAGERFPMLAVNLVDGRLLKLPDDLSADFTVVLGYRGKW